jgi:hypothetical protein
MFGMLTLKLFAFDRSARRCGPLARGLSEVARTKRVRAAAFGFQIAAKGRNVAPPAKAAGIRSCSALPAFWLYARSQAFANVPARC